MEENTFQTKKINSTFINFMYDFVAFLAIIALILLIVFSVYSYKSNNLENLEKNGTLLYYNNNFGFTFQYPASYIIEEGYYLVKVKDPETNNKLTISYAEQKNKNNKDVSLNFNGYLKFGTLNMKCIEITNLQVEYSDEFLLGNNEREQEAEYAKFKAIIDSINIPDCQNI